MEPKSVAIVVPTYNAEGHVGALLSAIGEAAKGSAHDWSVIIVDDGSSDATWTTLQREKAGQDMPVTAIRLTRNRGQHTALLTGLSQADADYVVTMDDDLQHAPADIEALLAPLDDGYDLVIGGFDHKRHSRGRNLGGRLVDGLLRRIFKLPKDTPLTAFRAFRRDVSEQAVGSRAAYPYLTALLLSNAARVTSVPVSHGEGTFRGTHYSLIRSLRLSANLVFGYTYLPVLAMIAASLIAVLSALGAMIWVVMLAAAPGGTSPGWASIVAIMSLFHGFTLISLAIIGVYVSRIHAVTTRESRVDSIGDIDG